MKSQSAAGLAFLISISKLQVHVVLGQAGVESTHGVTVREAWQRKTLRGRLGSGMGGFVPLI